MNEHSATLIFEQKIFIPAFIFPLWIICYCLTLSNHASIDIQKCNSPTSKLPIDNKCFYLKIPIDIPPLMVTRQNYPIGKSTQITDGLQRLIVFCICFLIKYLYLR